MIKAFIFSSSLIFTLFVYGTEIKSDKSNIERGFRFGEFKDSNSTLTDEEIEKLGKDQNNISKILALQLKEQKKHTELLTEIRDILQNEFSPKPKEIRLEDGTKCIENDGSDERCNRMPMINEVKQIPAIANAYKNPTIENIKKREMWYAWYTTQVLQDAYMKGQAIREMGPQYPLSTRPIGTVDSSKGWDGPLMSLHRKNLFMEHAQNFEFNIFLGMNKALDMYSLVALAYVVRDNPTIKFNLVFNSKESKKHWEKQYHNFYTANSLKKLPSFIQPEAFDEFKVYTTPSVFIKDLKNSKDTLIHVGKITELDLVNKSIEYMLNNKFIKRKDLSAQEFWNTKGSEDYMERYFNDNLGIDYEK